MASVRMSDRGTDSDYQGSEELMSEDTSEDYLESGTDGEEYLDTSREAMEAPARRNSKGYRVYHESDLEKMQDEAAQAVCSMWGCSPAAAKSLLIFYRWNKERLMIDLAERGPDEVFKRVGLPAGDVQPAAVSKPPEQSVCGVCFTEVAGSSCVQNSCGHAFCTDCWEQYLGIQINEVKAPLLHCMAFKCNVLLQPEVLTQLLQQDTDLRSKHHNNISSSYVTLNDRAEYCPSTPFCGHVVEVDSDPWQEPECKCGQTFCFKCREKPHSPCTCEMARLWMEKLQGDSETANWVTANTKPCPTCHKPVEKNGGCNHVTCTCGQSFCWLCGASTGRAHTWENIAGHSCGRWKEEMDSRIAEAARNHKRYMHYFERSNQHLDSLRREAKNRDKLLAQITLSEVAGHEARDFGWLVSALQLLRAARQLLGNSYAFAYYFFGPMYSSEFSQGELKILQDLFEDNQDMLAQEVERLSNLVDQATTCCGATLELNDELRLQCINSSAAINKRMRQFSEMCEGELYGKLQSSNPQIAVYHG